MWDLTKVQLFKNNNFFGNCKLLKFYLILLDDILVVQELSKFYFYHFE